MLYAWLQSFMVVVCTETAYSAEVSQGVFKIIELKSSLCAWKMPNKDIRVVPAYCMWTTHNDISLIKALRAFMSGSRIVFRDYANESNSNTQRFLGLLTSSKVKYKVLNWQESEITQKFNEMFTF